MCKQHICPTCRIYFFDGCDQVEFDPDRACGDDPTIYPRENCEACIMIEQVIEKLQRLTWRFGFLETEGLAGIEGLAEWEQGEARRHLIKDLETGSLDWEAQAESREERMKALANIQKMGLSDMEDARDEHQGFGSTPLDSVDKHHLSETD